VSLKSAKGPVLAFLALAGAGATGQRGAQAFGATGGGGCAGVCVLGQRDWH